MKHGALFDSSHSYWLSKSGQIPKNICGEGAVKKQVHKLVLSDALALYSFDIVDIIDIVDVHPL